MKKCQSIYGYAPEETASFLDNSMRHIISPRVSLSSDIGYAECMNAGKSRYNEDQSAINRGFLRSPSRGVTIPYLFVALFDGHGGSGVSLKASKELHSVLNQHLEDILDTLINLLLNPNPEYPSGGEDSLIEDGEDDDDEEDEEDLNPDDVPTLDELITGALESSFWTFDRSVLRDLKKYRITGGCTSLVALFILDKLYLANAGDSRAAVFYPHETNLIPLSKDHVPNAERRRIQEVAFYHPELLLHPETNQKLYSRPIFCRKNLTHADIDTPVLFTDFYMSGWSIRKAKEDDVNLVPLISGRGKNNRLLATVGVTRGLGDHQLFAKCSHVPLKEFLIPQPDVTVTDLRGNEGTLIMSTDGLWDVLSLEDIFTYFKDLEELSASENEMAKELVAYARGNKMPELYWEMSNGELASGDDISVFLVSIKKVYESLKVESSF